MTQCTSAFILSSNVFSSKMFLQLSTEMEITKHTAREEWQICKTLQKLLESYC